MSDRQETANPQDDCDHPLSAIERRGEPDWKNSSQTIWYYGFCTNCGTKVEVEYKYDGTKEADYGI